MFVMRPLHLLFAQRLAETTDLTTRQDFDSNSIVTNNQVGGSGVY
jgi:hypothetical protein